MGSKLIPGREPLVRPGGRGACAEVKTDLRPRIAARLAEAERRATEAAAFTASLQQALAHLDVRTPEGGAGMLAHLFAACDAL